jgi:hypothetical protein
VSNRCADWPAAGVDRAAQNLYANKATQIILLDAYDGPCRGNGARQPFCLPGRPFYAGFDYSDTRTVLQGQG